MPVWIFLGRWLPWIMIALALAFLAHEYRHHAKTFVRELAAFASAVSIAWLVALVLKWSVNAPRPFVVHDAPNVFWVHANTSFPSGHATFLFALASVAASYSGAFGLVLFVLAAAVSVARVMMGVHYPVDVVAGALIGTFIGYVAHRFMARLGR